MSATAYTDIRGGHGRIGMVVYIGVAAPTADNDASNGFQTGDRWLDTVACKVYDCFDATTGFANWRQATN